MNRQQRIGLVIVLCMIWIFLVIPEFTTFGYGKLPWYVSLLFGISCGMILNLTEK